MKRFERGSEWRKWDIHVHTKGTAKSDQFRSSTFEAFCTTMFKKALQENVSAIGITDYFRIDNYIKVKEYVENLEPEIISTVGPELGFSAEEIVRIKEILILPNVELRMIPVTDRGKLVNIHCIFNPTFINNIENDFFSQIKNDGREYVMNEAGFEGLGKDIDPSLDKEAAIKKGVENFVCSHGDLKEHLKSNRRFRDNVIIVVSNSSNDGNSAFQKHYELFTDNDPGSLEGIRKNIYTLSDAVFSSNTKDVKYFTGNGVDDKETVKLKCGSLKPCLHGSDAHSEEKLFMPDQDRYCWIKADLSFEGLKQVLYEPESGERVFIGPSKPDQKNPFKVISSLEFKNTMDFPEKVLFNSNLCSIIGSRSSGKSALLAYLSHAVEKEKTENIIKGPGEGPDFLWDNINSEDITYTVTWNNRKTNSESPGKVIYVPQNHLFNNSTEPEVLTRKIKPVLFNHFPEIRIKYDNSLIKIKEINEQIYNSVSNWFRIQEEMEDINQIIANIGNKERIEDEIKENEKTINSIREKNSFEEKEFRIFEEVREQIGILNRNLEATSRNLAELKEIDIAKYFKDIDIKPLPSMELLPEALRKKLDEFLSNEKENILVQINEQVKSYKSLQQSNEATFTGQIQTLFDENKEILERYRKHVEIEKLIVENQKYADMRKEIKEYEMKRKATLLKKDTIIEELKNLIIMRDAVHNELAHSIENLDYSGKEKLNFGVEIGILDGLEDLMRRINIRENSEFFNADRMINLQLIHSNPENYLAALYTGRQKIITGNLSIHVAIETFTLTKKILFTFNMEGDKIGGLSPTTMTPGKRALALLRLILAESNETWPLLIDQPEDDLDSRSIFEEIVPFLKEKKKERQIIMVSHNANLVIGADSEQIIVANRNGDDRPNDDGKQFNYKSGSLEYSAKKDENVNDTLKSQGIKEHTCDILDGGKEAFEKRRKRYSIESVC